MTRYRGDEAEYTPGSAREYDYAAHVPDEPDLFAPPKARVTDPPTSKAAALSMREPAKAQRARLLAELERADHGLTADELDERIGWRATTAGRRLKELAEMGLAVRHDGITRPTRSGRHAAVYTSVARAGEVAA